MLNVDKELSSDVLVDMYLKKVTIDVPELEEYPKNTLLGFEKEVSGVYTSGHPFELYSKFISSRTFISKLQDLVLSADDGNTEETISSDCTIGGMINSVKVINTKKGETMCFVEIEDETGTQSVVVFPKTYKLFKDLFVEGNPIAFYGTPDIKDEKISFIADEVIEITDDLETEDKKIVIDVKGAIDTSIFSKPGNTWVYLRYPNGHVVRSTTPRSVSLRDLKGVI
jgi:DNA polymerase III alpha subunit